MLPKHVRMIAQFQYTRLAHQAQAVQSIADVFSDVRFVTPTGVYGNPCFLPHEAAAALKTNIESIRAANQVTAGQVLVATTATPALSLDVLMETGTGKTFTFIETMHKLHQRHGLAKFIVLVPSNAIRQGTLKSLQTTADFFAREYNNQKINVFNYSDKTVKGFIHAANRGISVMVATYQSFAGDSKRINKRGVEANLFGQAKSYMEALAAMRPVLIIDEPHRFEGKQTLEYLAKFNPLLTLRFGATFKKDEYRNLVYTLDSLEAFRQNLVKGITVDSVGAGAGNVQTLCLHQVTGTAQARVGHLGFQAASGKAGTVALMAKDNLGEKTGLEFLQDHVVEAVTNQELRFTNGFALPVGEPTAFGMLADEMQSLIIQCAVNNHFEREESLFKLGIKALSLFFIDAVAKYLPEGGKPAVLRDAFERHYRAALATTLQKPGLDEAYRSYLERSAQAVGQVHKGYFARSHSEKGEEEAIKLILEEKEKLLSFDTDLRFIFSMWALQEGWDNPNVFTLCKLAPSNSKISKLQQIGRGLRLAVNQKLERVQADDEAFEAVNELVVVVPASEGDFVGAIQAEISAHSVRSVSQVLDQEVLKLNGVSANPFVTVALFTALAQVGIVQLDTETGVATLAPLRQTYDTLRPAVEKALQGIKGLGKDSAQALLAYLSAYYEGYGKVKRKDGAKKPVLHVNAAQFQKFRDLWQSLNRDAVLRYELDTAVLAENVLARIASSFDVKALSINIQHTTRVQNVGEVRSTTGRYVVMPHSVFTLAAFVRELANLTRLSFHTVAEILRRMPAAQFAQIRHNENRALTSLRDLILACVHELLVNKVSYELREIRVKTSLTDNTGNLLETVAVSLVGAESHPIGNLAVRERSLYHEPLMPVDSQIERDTVDESSQQHVTVFAKLPKIDIPTPVGKYNPDFGYVIHKDGTAQALYLVVETKGYDSLNDVAPNERWKINSAKQFFQALQDRGVAVHFRTKVNGETLAQLIQEIDPGLVN